MKSLIISLIEKYHPFNIRYFKSLVVLTITSLSIIVLLLGWMSSRNVREVVTDDFNQQQLLLARHAASQIESSIETVKRELILLSLSPAIHYAQSPSFLDRMNISFSSIRHEGVREIRFIEIKTHKVYRVRDQQKYSQADFSPEDIEHLQWARLSENRGKILITDIYPASDEDQRQLLIMEMISPVWKTSVDAPSSVAANACSGALVFIVDAGYLVGKVTKKIQSGKTGYAWVIDDKGTFLYHEESSFIGKNAFEARKGIKPTISFDRINEIQREKMLKGAEGTSWYISGWHRGLEGEIKKLIAYTPVGVSSTPKSHIWSIAVVAPVSEVEGAISSILTQHIILQALVIFIILSGGLFINFMILGWSNMLTQEVTKKTAELKKSEQKYKSLVENAEDIIFSIDYNGNFLSINKYGAEFFQKTESNIVGHNLSEILSRPSADSFLLNIQKVFETKESQQLTHLVIIGERQCWFSTNLRRLFDEKGNIYAVLGISRDITERRKIEEHSYYTEKLASMGTLAAGVAHEINNPLGVILGFTEILLEKVPPDSQEHDLLKTIERQGLNAKRVVENLLNFARHKEHEEKLVNINEQIESVLAVMRNNLLVNKITLKKFLENDPPLIKVDPGELQQVFFNIINNAIHAMQGSSKCILTISTRSLHNSMVEIRITDTGHGIKKEHRKRIFDPLFTTKEVGKGTGLGLSVSYGIVTKHGGTITFKSKTREESEETGTSFIITFPAVSGEHAEIK